MTATIDASNREVLVCDGCGRQNGGPGVDLGIKPYLVHDPNVGSRVQHHYCGHCASNRGTQIEELRVTWPSGAVVVPVADQPEAALSAELPAPVDDAIEAAERLEQQAEATAEQ